jgi:hypothetical protein
MKFYRNLLILLITLILASCHPPEPLETPIFDSADPGYEVQAEETTLPTLQIQTSTANARTTLPSEEMIQTPTPDPFSSLYGCEMEVMFISGPLEKKSAEFTVLGRDYFLDKGDKFAPGKGTSIYYKAQQYFILHSSFVNGNILRPMEAEFLRKYLEYWGITGDQFIQGQIDRLVGSEVYWICDGQLAFKTRINGIVRLSHEASNRLWLEPENLEQILEDREGLASEWVGEMEETDIPYLYIGFCGWGPESKGDERFTYFRYLIRFEILH